MRWLVAGALIAAAAIAWAATGRGGVPRPVVWIEATYPHPVAEGRLPGATDWIVRTSAGVRGGCRGPRFSARTQVSFDGGPDPYGSGSSASSAPAYLEAAANAGDVVSIVARARCPGGPWVTASRHYSVPTASCDAGPLRVLELRGRGRVIRETWDLPPASLRVGRLVLPGDTIALARGALAVVGAPECNGFRAVVSPGTTRVGGYESRGRGASFGAERLVLVGDRSAGGVEPLEGTGLIVIPVSRSVPASFAVRSRAGRAGVRVYAGRVEIRGAGRTAVLRAFQEAWISCGSRSCRATGARLYQPGEPLSTRPLPAPRFARTLRGSALPVAAVLAPARSETTIHELRGGAGEPDELVVTWQRHTRVASPGGRVLEAIDHGMLVWARTPGGWRVAYEHRAIPDEPYGGARFGDVTGDGRADVLIDDGTGGTAGCGTRLAVASAHGTMREIFRESFCEGATYARRGRLVLDEPIGPCPVRQGSAHCFGGRKRTSFRWNGERLVPSRVEIECALPRLEPAKGCR